MVGRFFFILLLGMLASAIIATMVVNERREQTLNQREKVHSVDRLQNYVSLLDGVQPALRERLLNLGGPGIHRLTEPVPQLVADPDFAALLRARGGALATTRVWQAADSLCRPALPAAVYKALQVSGAEQTHAEPSHRRGMQCRLINLTLKDGTPLRFAMASRTPHMRSVQALDPVFILLLAAALAVLAYVVARMASSPLRRLAGAASALGKNLQVEPMPLSGPEEVRSATTAFNAMQARIQQHLGERTQMLASITHDLQTPLTRMRLRLEAVDDPDLREQLVADLAVMQALIREGLELARSAETSEVPVPLDLDSLLQSLVDDAVEAGADVRFESGCGVVLMVRPLGMQRVFANLMHNARKYARSVQVCAERHGDRVQVSIRDDGPGIPQDQLEAVLEPFVRIEGSRSRETGGTGLGLAIAQRLAAKDGAMLTLRNLPAGGLEATVSWRHAPVV